MSNILWKNFHHRFFKLKCLPPPQPSEHPRHHHPPPPDDRASATTPTPALVKNSNSLHDTTSPENSTTSSNFTPHNPDDSFFTSSSEDSDFAAGATSPPELASVYASQRFFFSSPGISNSIIDSPDSLPPPSRTNPAESSTTPVAGTGGFTVQKYSSDPYRDFRRSMQEMIEARDMTDLNDGSWEYLQELLLCYLTLNPRQTHQFIVGAFTDTVVHLMSRPPPRTPSLPAVSAGKPRKLGGRQQGATNRSRKPFV